jgi:hypothetical protein
MQQVLLNVLSVTAVHFIERDLIGDVSMSSVKFAAAIAAVLFMSAGAAEAGGRPFVDSGMVSLPPSILVMSLQDRERANHHIARLAPIGTARLASRHRPVSKPISARLAVMVPDCLRTDRVITSFKLTAPIAVGFEKALAAGDIRFADRIVTSSMSRPKSADICIGSIAPCGAGKFAEIQPIVPPSIWIRHYVSH